MILLKRMLSLTKALPQPSKQFNFQIPKVRQYSAKQLLKMHQIFSLSLIPYSLNSVQHKIKKQSLSHKIFEQHHKQQGLYLQLLKLFNKYQSNLSQYKQLQQIPIQHNLKKQYISAIGTATHQNVKIDLIQGPNQQICQLVDVQYIIGFNKNRHLNLNLQKYEKKQLGNKQGIHAFILDILQFKNEVLTQQFAYFHRQIILRLTFQMKLKKLFKINFRNQEAIQSDKKHTVIFQSQLKEPPIFSEYEMHLFEWIRLAQTNDDWWISDVDNNNKLVQLAYDGRTFKRLDFSIVN